MTPCPQSERDALVIQYLPLAIHCVKKFASGIHGDDRDDLLQEARLGLVDAADTFDPERGAFMTHACWRIRGRLSKALYKLARRGFCRCPEDGARRPASLSLLHDRAEQPDDWLDREWFDTVLAGLPDRERYIVEQRFRFDRTLREIAAEVGVNAERVRQIVQEAIQRLRDRHLEGLE